MEQRFRLGLKYNREAQFLEIGNMIALRLPLPGYQPPKNYIGSVSWVKLNLKMEIRRHYLKREEIQPENPVDDYIHHIGRK